MKKSKGFIALCKKYGVNPDNVAEIISYEDACKQQELDPIWLPIVNHLPARHQKRQIADYKLSVIADSLRGLKDANYNDINEYKYFPVFLVEADDKRRSGFGLSYDGYDGWYSRSNVGVRLCFPNRDTVIFFGKHFIELHKDHHLLT